MQKSFLKRLLLFGLLLVAVAPLAAQPDKVYRSLSDVKDPQQVYILHLRWKRLRSIPPEVFTFTNLRELVSFLNTKPHRNLIRHLPMEIGLLGDLQHVDLNRNPIESLPDEMAYLPSLRELVLWSTNITTIPESFSELDGTLQLLDLRSCSLTYDEQQAIEQILPSTKKRWDQACNCR